MRRLGSLLAGAGLVLSLALAASSARAADLALQPGWSSLASDRIASRVGDTLTVLVYQDASASNTAQNGSKKTTRAGGEVGVNTHSQAAHLDISSNFDGGAQTGRADKMVAQVGVVVTDVLANGDLRVAGEQSLALNGEKTHIRVSGRVRPLDISNANTVISARLAEAVIDYDGRGFVSRSSKPGLVHRLISGLGVF